MYRWAYSLQAPASAVERIKLVPSVCVSVIQHSYGRIVRHMKLKFGTKIDLGDILDVWRSRSKVKVTRLKNMFFGFSYELTCACSLCHVIWCHVTSQCDVIWHFWARILTLRTRGGNPANKKYLYHILPMSNTSSGKTYWKTYQSNIYMIFFCWGQGT